MTIYLSGKITGINPEHYEKKFQEAEDYLKSKGYDVYNPVKVFRHKHLEMVSREEAMRVLVSDMLKCNAIYMLNDWQSSEGCVQELSVARLLKLDIHFQHDNKL